MPDWSLSGCVPGRSRLPARAAGLVALVAMTGLAGCGPGAAFVDAPGPGGAGEVPVLGQATRAAVCFGGPVRSDPGADVAALAETACARNGLTAVFESVAPYRCALTTPHVAYFACLPPAAGEGRAGAGATGRAREASPAAGSRLGLAVPAPPWEAGSTPPSAPPPSAHLPFAPLSSAGSGPGPGGAPGAGGVGAAQGGPSPWIPGAAPGASGGPANAPAPRSATKATSGAAGSGRFPPAAGAWAGEGLPAFPRLDPG